MRGSIQASTHFDVPLTRVQRAVSASVGLLVTGALLGAGVGVGVLEVWGLMVDGPGGFPYVWFAFEYAAEVGAVLGGVLLPLVTWTILPNVAFGRIFVETTIGTAAGAALAILDGGLANPFVAVLGGAIGFLVTVIQLKLRRPRQAHTREVA